MITCRHDSQSHGFTLIETIIAVTVLVAGVVAAAEQFSYAVQTARSADQIVSGAFLASAKARELSSRGIGEFAAGGSLDPDSPDIGYFDYLKTGPEGQAIPGEEADATLLRVWWISPLEPRRVVVAVYGRRAGAGGEWILLANALAAIRGTP